MPLKTANKPAVATKQLSMTLELKAGQDNWTFTKGLTKLNASAYCNGIFIGNIYAGFYEDWATFEANAKAFIMAMEETAI